MLFRSIARGNRCLDTLQFTAAEAPGFLMLDAMRPKGVVTHVCE